MKITKDSPIKDVLTELGDEAVDCMLGYGLACVSCHFNTFDTIEAGCRLHRFSDAIIAQLVQDLNQIASTRAAA